MTSDRTLADIDAALESWEHGDDASRWHADGDGPDELDEVDEELSCGTLVVFADFASAARTMEDLRHGFAALSAAWPGSVKSLVTAFRFPRAGCLHAPDAPRRVTRRCRACHPEAFGLPLAMDGREYRRRQRARRRRG